MDAKERKHSALELFGNVDLEKDVEDNLKEKQTNENVLQSVEEKRSFVDTI